MKKFLLLVFVLCISLTACQTASHTESTSSEESTSVEAPTESVSDTIPEICVTYDLLTLTSLDEYEAFLETTEGLPDNFVHYDDIRQFGSFGTLIILSNARIGEYYSYLYYLVDDNGFESALYVKDLSEGSMIEETVITSVGGTDLRALNVGEYPDVGKYACGELWYIYRHGELSSVRWVQNDLKFTLTGTDVSLSQYPDNESTPTGKLLNAELVSEAYEAYLAPITAQ